MTTPSFTSRVRNKESLLGTWLYMNDVSVAEVVARAGFDFLFIDMEHSATDFSSLHTLLLATERWCPVIVRVQANEPQFISKALDLGATGVMVPMIRDADDARKAIEYARYAPLGRRGMGPVRAGNYGRNGAEYIRRANEQTLLFLQIEMESAVRDIRRIAVMEGVDALFVGPGDLSQALGHPGNMTHPIVTQFIADMLHTVQSLPVPVGIALSDADRMAHWRDLGMTIFTSGADFRFVTTGAQTFLEGGRRALEQSAEPQDALQVRVSPVVNKVVAK